MLLWYIRFRGYAFTPSEINELARAALKFNRAMGRDKYHPVRIGTHIIPAEVK